MQRTGRDGNRARRAGLLAAAWLLCAPAMARAQATPEGNPLVQRDVPAEATAENAVVARDRALAAGQRLAYERMAAQLGLPRGLPDQQIEAQVASLVIESERVTPRGYSARITVNFRPPGRAAQPAGGAGGPAISTIDATAVYQSFPEYIEIRRRVGATPAVARVEILSIAGDTARLRLALRSLPPVAATDLAGAGLEVAPVQGGAGGEAWRLGLAPGR
jgi:hypothetical protein